MKWRRAAQNWPVPSGPNTWGSIDCSESACNRSTSVRSDRSDADAQLSVSERARETVLSQAFRSLWPSWLRRRKRLPVPPCTKRRQKVAWWRLSPR